MPQLPLQPYCRVRELRQRIHLLGLQLSRSEPGSSEEYACRIAISSMKDELLLQLSLERRSPSWRRSSSLRKASSLRRWLGRWLPWL